MALKSIVAITALFAITKLVGKRHIAQLTFFDYIIGIAIGSIAGAASIDRRIDYLSALTAIITWGVFAFFVAFLSQKSMRLRRFFNSTPTVFIQNGKIVEGNLKKEKININDFLEELRIKGVFNVSDVEFAILEPDGELSVQLKSQKRPLKPEDMNIPTRYEGIAANLIIDGNIMKENLHTVKLDEKWLFDELAKKNIFSEKEVLLAVLDTDGKLYVSLKGMEENDVRKVLN